MEFLPDSFVRPVGDVVVWVDLDAESTDLGRAHAVQGEPAIVLGVDQLVGRWRHIGEDPEPGEWIAALPLLAYANWDRAAGHTMESVTPGDDVAAQLMLETRVNVVDHWFVGLEAIDVHLRALKPQWPTGLDSGRDQILDDLGLTVDGHRASAGQLIQRDVMVAAVKAQVDASVDKTLAGPAIPQSRLR